ncbi:TIM-barrel domain-containing protein [Pseudomonas alliivorans]|nr:TIM-barrel domain-containing protein [Pseudomonas alliivorans]MEE5056457.1 TIM-barrel domain-containing protein [Pseudomonas alliivorans]MEE5072741.1 TIM-barrel domain-containing protein [Pseudomonas alliivorans]
MAAKARGGHAGLQRYSARWTGDSASSWDFLRINLPQVLNLGLSGIPLSGCDLGGFGPGEGSVGQSMVTNIVPQ